MKTRANLSLAWSTAALAAILLGSAAPVIAGGDPPGPDMICKDIPNPVYEGCKVAVKCNTAPFGGTYCGFSGASFCNRVTDPAKVAEDAAKIAIAAAVCSFVPPANAIQGKGKIAVAQATAACAVSTAEQQPRIKDGFCNTLNSFVDLCPGPATINLCKWPWEW